MPIKTHPVIDSWFQDPEFKKLSDDKKVAAIENWFDGNLATDDFYQAPLEQQANVRTNFISNHFLKHDSEHQGPTQYHVAGAAKQTGLEAARFPSDVISGVGKLTKRAAEAAPEEPVDLWGPGQFAQEKAEKPFNMHAVEKKWRDTQAAIGQALINFGNIGVEYYDSKANSSKDIREFREAAARGDESLLTQALGAAGNLGGGIAVSMIPGVGPVLAGSGFFNLNKEEVREAALQKLLESGLSKEEAEVRAEELSWAGGMVSSALDTIGAGRIAHTFKPAGKLMNGLIGLLITSQIEGGTEALQSVTAQITADYGVKPEDMGDRDFIKMAAQKFPEYLKNAKTDYAVGALLGCAGHVVRRGAERLSRKPDKPAGPVELTGEQAQQFNAFFGEAGQQMDLASRVPDILNKARAEYRAGNITEEHLEDLKRKHPVMATGVNNIIAEKVRLEIEKEIQQEQAYTPREGVIELGAGQEGPLLLGGWPQGHGLVEEKPATEPQGQVRKSRILPEPTPIERLKTRLTGAKGRWKDEHGGLVESLPADHKEKRLAEIFAEEKRGVQPVKLEDIGYTPDQIKDFKDHGFAHADGTMSESQYREWFSARQKEKEVGYGLVYSKGPNQEQAQYKESKTGPEPSPMDRLKTRLTGANMRWKDDRGGLVEESGPTEEMARWRESVEKELPTPQWRGVEKQKTEAEQNLLERTIRSLSPTDFTAEESKALKDLDKQLKDARTVEMDMAYEIMVNDRGARVRQVEAKIEALQKRQMEIFRQAAERKGAQKSGKAPWEMTRSELEKHVTASKDKNGVISMSYNGVPLGSPSLAQKHQDVTEFFNAAHKQAIEIAVAEGKPVRPEILAEYGLSARTGAEPITTDEAHVTEYSAAKHKYDSAVAALDEKRKAFEAEKISEADFRVAWPELEQAKKEWTQAEREYIDIVKPKNWQGDLGKTRKYAKLLGVERTDIWDNQEALQHAVEAAAKSNFNSGQERLIAKTFKGKVPSRLKGREAPDLFLTGGLGGAGKSSGGLTKEIERTHVVGNPDVMKELAGRHEGLDAERYHPESSALAKEVLKRSLGSGYDTVWDSTLSNYQLAHNNIVDVLNSGGKVIIGYADIDWLTSRVRTTERFEDPETPNRIVPDEGIVKAYNYSLPTFLELYKKFKDDPNITINIADNRVDRDTKNPEAKAVPIIVKNEVKNQKLLDNLLKTDYFKSVEKGKVKYVRTPETQITVADLRTPESQFHARTRVHDIQVFKGLGEQVERSKAQIKRLVEAYPGFEEKLEALKEQTQPANAPPTPQSESEQKAAGSSSQAAMSMWDKIAAERAENKKAAGKSRKPSNKSVSRSKASGKKAKHSLKETANHASNMMQGLRNALAALGEEGFLSSDPIDEAKWEKIKPHLKYAWDEAVLAGKSLKEFVEAAMDVLGEKGRPYFERFVNEELKEGSNEQQSEPGKFSGQSMVEGEDAVLHGDSTDNDMESVPEEPEGPVPATGDVGEPGGGLREGTEGEPGKPGRGSDRGTGDELPVSDGRDTHESQAGTVESAGTGGVAGEPAREEDRNHVITDDDVIAPRGDETKIKGNIRAIRLLRKLRKEDRNPTRKEKKILAQYVGWGAFSQKVFNREFTDYLKHHSKQWTPEQYFYDENKLNKYNQWVEKYGKSLHPDLGGMLTEAEWASARASTTNAHYTSRPVIKTMWQIAERLGFKGGNVLEPAGGIGHFFGLMPKHLSAKSRLYGVEKDTISGEIFKKLYPQAHIDITPLEQDKRVLDNSQDLVITNVPFADVAISDKRHRDYSGFKLHNYFLARSISALKPGGIAIAITSTWSMDAKTGGKVREYLGTKADLIGAVRLPNTAFKANAGTDVTTDILVFRKKDSNAVSMGREFRLSHPTPISKEDRDAIKEFEAASADYKYWFKEVTVPKGAKRAEKEEIAETRAEVKERLAEAQRAYSEIYSINEYFLNNPGMVLGKHSKKGTMYASNTYTVEPEGKLEEKLQETIGKFPENIVEGIAPYLAPEKEVFAQKGAKEGVLTRDEAGKIMLVSDGRLVTPFYFDGKGKKVPVSKRAQVNRLKGYYSLRESTKELIDMMADPEATDAQIKAKQQEMGKLYDDYVKKFKHLGTVSNSFLRKTDNEFSIVDALEKKHVERFPGKKDRVTFSKADIFTERTIFPFVEPAHAESVDDAVSQSIIYRGKIDPGHIAGLLGEDNVGKVVKEIVDKGLAFVDPETGMLEQRDVYLSGNVKRKLRAARDAAEGDESYKKNVEALEPIIPEDLDIEFIDFRIGSSWVPAKAYEDFAAEILDTQATVVKSVAGDSTRWRVDPTAGQLNPKNRETWATRHYLGTQLIEFALNFKRPTVKVPDPTDPDGRRMIKSEEGTREANLKIQEISDEFVRWAKTHETWADQLGAVYNEEKNGTVLMKQSAPNIDHYPNAAKHVALKEHQKIAVARGLRESTLMAYGVGTGKTYIYITLSQEMKRIGTARKPLIVVHNATIDQYRRKFAELYPGAKVLIPNEGQRQKSQRKKLLSSMATGNWDAIVLPHSFFDGVANDPQREAAYVEERIAELEEEIRQAQDEGDDPWSVKDLEKLLEKKRQKLLDLLDRRKDEELYFEQMGIDALLIDEAHTYKRSEFFTKLNKVKGIDSGNAQKSVSFLLKSNYVREKTGGKNVILATGTPISNTMAELWTMMRYIRPELLQEYGVTSFDDFAGTFGDVVEGVEETPSGFKEVERFARYVNGPELLNMFFSAADVRLTRDAGLRLPDISDGKPTAVVNEKSPELRQFISNILARWRAWENLPGRDKACQKHVPLQLYGLAKKAAVDLRLVDPVKYKFDPKGKLGQAVEHIYAVWKETDKDQLTQVAFLDIYQDQTKSFNAYKDIKQRLMDKGIPKDQILIFNEAKNEKQQELYKNRIKEGDARIIIGSTAKLGIGVNIADKLIAAHHISVPDRPMDIEQRNGRIVRQTNTNPEVRIFHYMTKETLDSVLFDRLSKKQKFSDQVLSGDISGRTFDDPFSEEQASFAEFAAAASGEAGKLLFEKNDLIAQEHKFRVAEQAHVRQVSEARKAKRELPIRISDIKEKLANAEAFAETLKKEFPDLKIGEEITFEGKAYKKRSDFLAAVEKVIESTKKEWIKKYKGMKFSEYKTHAGKEREVSKEVLAQAGNVRITIGIEARTNYSRYADQKKKIAFLEPDFGAKHPGISNPYVSFRHLPTDTRMGGNWIGDFTGSFTSTFNRAIKAEVDYPERIRKDLEEFRAELKEMKSLADKEFKYSEDLTRVRNRLSEINRELVDLDRAEKEREHEELNGEPAIDTVPTQVSLGDAIPISRKDAKKIQALADDMVSWIKDVAPRSVRRRMHLSLENKIGISKFNAAESHRQWREMGREPGFTLGATTVNALKATVQVSYAVSDPDAMQTLRHEYLHVAMRWLLPDGDYKTVLDHFKGNEEAAADAFAAFVAGKEKPAPAIIKIFRRLRLMFKRISNGLKGQGYRTHEDVFEKLMGKGYELLPQEKIDERVTTGESRLSRSSVRPWPADFPKAYAHTTVKKVTDHPDFKAAKAGDARAAMRLAKDLMKPDRIAGLAKQYPNAIVVPVREIEAEGINMIPMAMGRLLGKAGVTIDENIHQISTAKRKGLNAVERLKTRKVFDGEVDQGAQYILVDDILTQGGTAHELRHYIVNNGGKVVAVSSLAFSAGSNIIAIKDETVNAIKERFGRDRIENLLQEYNVSGTIEALTDSEGRAILRFKTLDAFRKKMAEGRVQESVEDHERGVLDSPPDPTNAPLEEGQPPAQLNLSPIEKKKESFADAFLLQFAQNRPEPPQTVLNKVEREKVRLNKELPKENLNHWGILKNLPQVHKGKDDVKGWERLLSVPSHFFRKIPALGRVFETGVRSVDNRQLLTDEIVKAPDGHYYTADIDALKRPSFRLPKEERKARKAEYKRLSKYLKYRDQNQIGYARIQNPETEQWEVFHYKDRQRSTPLASFDEESDAVDQMIDLERSDYLAAGGSTLGADALAASRHITNNGFSMLFGAMRELKEHYKEIGENLPTEAINIDGKRVEVDLKYALAHMGDMRGYYMPRIRKPGRYAVFAEKKGTNPVRKHFELKKTAQVWANSQRKKGYTVSIKEQKKMPEDVFEMAGQVLAHEALINEALSRIHGKEYKLADFGLTVVKRPMGKMRDVMVTGPTTKAMNKVFKSMGGRFYPSDPGGMRVWHFENPLKGFEKRLAKAIAYSNATLDIETKSQALFAKALVEQVANVIKARGVRQHMIGRNEATGIEVWEGYEKDPGEAFGRYARGVAAGEAKKIMARDMLAAFTGTDISWRQFQGMEGGTTYEKYMAFVADRRVDPVNQQNAYKEGKSYIENMLRNEEAVDRAVGFVRGLGVLKYLAGRVSAPVVNLTAMVTSVPAAMEGFGNIPINKGFRYLAKAGKHYAAYAYGDKESLPKDIRLALDQIHENGWHNAQFNREALAVLRSKAGRGWDKMIDLGMIGFGATEKINRVTTILGAYMGAKAHNEGMDHDAALVLAKDISDKSHAIYGKANYPLMARGKHPAAHIMKAFYVFRTFSHNYLLTMKDLWGGKMTPEHGKAFAYMAIAPGILAGAGGVVGWDLIMKAMGQAFDLDDPEEGLYAWLYENIGEHAENVARFGLFGLANINLKGSLEIGVTDLPTNLVDLAGAPGSVIMDVFGGIREMTRGNVSKGFEKALPLALANPVKAYRESTEGLTTKRNAPLFYGSKQVKASLDDAILRAFSFNPARIAKVREIQWSEQKTKYEYRDRADDIRQRIKKFMLKPTEERDKAEWADLMEEVREYNTRVKERGLVGLVPVFTPRSILSNIRRTFRPSRWERTRNAQNKKN